MKALSLMFQNKHVKLKWKVRSVLMYLDMKVKRLSNLFIIGKFVKSHRIIVNREQR